MAERHILCCDCLDCLDPGGVRFPGAGAVFVTRMKFGGKPLPPPIRSEVRDSERVVSFSPELTEARSE